MRLVWLQRIIFQDLHNVGDFFKLSETIVEAQVDFHFTKLQGT